MDILAAILTFIEKFYNSIKYNGFYIFLSLLFPIIILELDAGREIISSMTETGFALDIALSPIVFAALGFSVWCIPTLSINLFKSIVNYNYNPKDPAKDQQLKICLFSQLIFIYDGSGKEAGEPTHSNLICENKFKPKLQFSMEIFALAPWILFIVTCTSIFYYELRWVLLLVIAVLGIIGLGLWSIYRFRAEITGFFTKYLYRQNNRGEVKLVRFLVPIIIAVVLISAIALLSPEEARYHSGKFAAYPKWLMIAVNIIFLFIFFGFITYLQNEKFTKQEAYRISNFNYKTLIVFLLGGIIVFYFLNKYQKIGYISPIIIIILMCSFLIVLFELFFASQQLLISIVSDNRCDCGGICALKKPASPLRLKAYRYGLYLLCFFLIYQFFFSSLNSHRIRRVESVTKLAAPRQSLTDYFDTWYRSRKIENDDSVIYLVSGQGGGSRAASHFYMTMALLEKYNKNFFKKVFSISTVSGSSSGANMYLATKLYNINYGDSLKSPYMNKDAIRQKAIDLYGRNYMSSAFFGLMMGDGIQYFACLGDNYTKDRNYFLQREELAAFENTFQKDSMGFFEKDYLHVYGDTSLHWPLFMINTTIIDFGVRGVFSPVATNNFSLARDLYGEFKKDNCNAGFDIPTVTCVNQSQAFPLLSAYNYMDCVGRFGDGGIVENTGCATTLDIYRALRAYCNDLPAKKGIKIICLNIYNGSLEEEFVAPFKNASILNTATAATRSPFDGNQYYAYKNLSNQIAYLKTVNDNLNPADTTFDFPLGAKITLTRTLSERSVDSIFKKITDTSRHYKLRY